jgi:hypothetical protein
MSIAEKIKRKVELARIDFELWLENEHITHNDDVGINLKISIDVDRGGVQTKISGLEKIYDFGMHILKQFLKDMRPHSGYSVRKQLSPQMS